MCTLASNVLPLTESDTQSSRICSAVIKILSEDIKVTENRKE